MLGLQICAYILLTIMVGFGALVFYDELVHREYRSVGNLIACGFIVTIAVVLLIVMICNPLPQTIGTWS